MSQRACALGGVMSGRCNASVSELKRLFAEVCDLPRASRADRLNALTQDPALVKDVLALAEASDIRTSHATLIAGPMSELLAGAVRSEMAVGDRLGAWSLNSILGEGGMGSVFLADRVDGHFKQQAAVKVLHGIPSVTARENLAQERQILANLAHPYIAKLFDGGSTPRGRPYLVMAYVCGLQIDDYCRTQQLTTPEILRLYLHVCEPVAFAHQHLVVHCDLKPSNVLIDASGRPALLDFGIARLINASDPSGPIKAFTPRYASPEQQTGAPVSTTTDVYSLGVMLRELITVSNREIDAIVRKATAHAAQHRYASVDAFADDIKRHLNGRLVTAMPATPVYRAQKFVTRRWPQLLAASVFLATVFGFAAQLIAARDLSETARLDAQQQRDGAQSAQAEAVRQRDRAQNAELDALNDRNRAQESAQLAISERDRTRAAELQLLSAKNLALLSQRDAARSASETRLEAEQSAAVSKFMESLFAGANPDRAGRADMTALALLDDGRKRVQADLAQHPTVRARLMFAIAQSYELMGQTRSAQELYRETEQLERGLSPARPLHLAELLRRLSFMALSAGKPLDAAAYAQESLSLREAKLAPSDDAIAASRSLVAFANGNSKNWQETEQVMLQSVASLVASNRGESEEAASRLRNIAEMLVRVGQLSKAETYFQRALPIYEAAVGSKHPQYLNTLESLAACINKLNRFAEAEPLLRQSVALRAAMYGPDSARLAEAQHELADVLMSKGDHAEAIALMEKSVAIHEKQSGRNSRRVAIGLNGMAFAHEALGNLAAAEAMYRESLSIREKVLTAQPLVLARAQENLARFLMRQGKVAQARPFLESATKALQDHHPETHADRIANVLTWVDWHQRDGTLDEARAHLLKASAHEKTMPTLTHAMWLRMNASVNAAVLGRQEAERQLLEHEAIYAKALGAQHGNTLTAPLERADLLARLGDTDAAKRLAIEVSVALSKATPPISLPLSTKMRIASLTGGGR